MADLLDILGNGIIGGGAGNVAYELIKGAWTRLRRQSWEAMYLRSFNDAFEEEKPRLIAKYASADGETALDEDELRRSLTQDLAVDPASLSFGAAGDEEFASRLGEAMAQRSVLIIGGNNLSPDDYAQLVRNLIRRARSAFKDAILADEAAFRRAVMDELLAVELRLREIQREAMDSRALLLEVEALLKARLDVNIQLVTELRDEVRTGFKEVGGKVDELRDLVEGRVILYAVHSLPPAPADFVGREEEAERIERELQASGSAAISGLVGMGGVGKTALALVLAHRLASQYPDAQIYLELKGTSNEPVSPVEAMLQVIHAFAPIEDLRRATQDEIANRYRSVLAGRRTLLLLDNAADAPQVRSLMPPPPCGLLITSRSSFTLPGLQPVRLDVLPEQQAKDLLLEVCPRIAAEAGNIAELCGRLPLALRVAGSTLAESPNLAPAAYAASLADRRTRLVRLKAPGDPDLNVEAAIGMSYERLEPRARRLWRTLAVFPAPFDGPAAAAVWDMGQWATEQLLGNLLRSSMVQYDSGAGRYSLHDLTAVFAEGHLKPKERPDAQFRHAKHYLAVAREANDRYVRGEVLEGLALFDRELPHIRAGQSWAAGITLAPARGRAARDADLLCAGYAGDCALCLDLRLPPREHILWQEAALIAARRLGNRGWEAAHVGNLGIAYAQLGETGKAIDYYQSQLDITRETRDRQGEGRALGNLGLAYAELGNSLRAVEYHENNLLIAQQIGDRRGEASALCNLGVAYRNEGELREAMVCYLKALAILPEIGDPRGEATLASNVGNIFAAEGFIHQAKERYQRSLDICRNIGDRLGEGHALLNMGVAQKTLGEVSEARQRWLEALVIFEDLESPDAQRVRGLLAESGG